MRAKKLQKLKVKEENNPVYFRLGYYESIDAKKDLLSSEMSFLNIIKIARKYNSLRAEEFEIKNKMYRAVKELEIALRKTKNFFPFFKIPELTKVEEIRKGTPVVRKDFDDNIERELRSIQEKLRTISQY
jgi:hypothetical protein